MDADARAEIRGEIASRLKRAELALLLGAGFSLDNQGGFGTLPTGTGLRDLILKQCGQEPGASTTLKDAYAYGRRELCQFDDFLASVFTVAEALPWQQRIFGYPWSRIYTTNIDNVLSMAHQQAIKSGRVGGEFRFLNYCDPGVLEESLGKIPVISIHGSCSDLSKGFIFSGQEYGEVSAKLLDWHRELAARILSGGLVVVGSQLDESDLDASVAARVQSYPDINDGAKPRNWIVMPGPDPIKAANYQSMGFYVIDSTAEEFFSELFGAASPLTVAEAVAENFPAIKKLITNREAATWLKSAFKPAILEIDESASARGILKNFIAGSQPEWMYIVHDAHAKTSRSKKIVEAIGTLMHAHAIGVAALHVIGSSGSGKTTELMAAISELVAAPPG